MRFLLLTLILLYSFTGFGQSNQVVDSLLNKLKTLTENNARIEALNELAFQFRRKDPIQAKSFAEEAKLLSQKLKNVQGEATAYLRLGLVAKIEENYKNAEEYYQLALPLRQKIQDKKGVSSVYNNLGNLSKLLGDFEQAGGYFEAAIEALPQDESLSLKSKIHNNSANVFKQTANYEKAIFHYEKALDLKEKLEDEVGKALVMSNLGFLYIELNNFEKAKEYLTNGLIIFRENKETYQEAVCLLNIGNLHYQEGELSTALANYEKASELKSALDDQNLAFLYKNKGNTLKAMKLFESALENYRSSLTLFENLENLNEIAAVNSNIGVTHSEMNEPKQAIPYFEKSLTILDDLDNPVLKSIVLFNLSEAYLNLKDYDKAFELNTLYNHLRDSINQNYKEAMTYKVNLEEDRRKIAQLEKETTAKTAALERQDLINKGLVGFGVLWVLLTIATVFGYINRQKRRLAEKNAQIATQNEQLAWQEIDDLLQKQELETTYARLEGQEHERQRIAQDLHDRLGSMLATVKLYFAGFEEKIQTIQKKHFEQQQKASELLDVACQEVRRIAHDMQSGTLARFGLEAELRAMAQTLEDSNQIKAQVLVYGMKDRLDNKIEVGLYRIIQELVSNILKHAKASKMSIQLNQIGNELNIMVEDDGKGFQPELAKKSGGMGLSGIQKRVEELNGTLNIDSGKGRGTTVIIDLRLEP